MLGLFPTINPVETVQGVFSWTWAFLVAFLPFFVIVLIIWLIKTGVIKTTDKIADFFHVKARSISEKKCPNCMSWIDKEAKVCKHCRRDV